MEFSKTKFSTIQIQLEKRKPFCTNISFLALHRAIFSNDRISFYGRFTAFSKGVSFLPGHLENEYQEFISRKMGGLDYLFKS